MIVPSNKELNIRTLFLAISFFTKSIADDELVVVPIPLWNSNWHCQLPAQSSMSHE
jgi:hypothetical protein